MTVSLPASWSPRRSPLPDAPPRYSPFAGLRKAGLLRPATYERDKRRGTAHERGYDSRWQRTSRGYLDKHPLCVASKANGIIRAATLVDHIIPHRGDKKLFWDPTNWQALSDEAHNTIKKILEVRWDQGLISAAELRLDRPLPEFFALPPGGV